MVPEPPIFFPSPFPPLLLHIAPSLPPSPVSLPPASRKAAACRIIRRVNFLRTPAAVCGTEASRRSTTRTRDRAQAVSHRFDHNFLSRSHDNHLNQRPPCGLVRDPRGRMPRALVADGPRSSAVRPDARQADLCILRQNASKALLNPRQSSRNLLH